MSGRARKASRRWHQRPHVKRWWVARDTLEETEGHYVPTIDGTEPTDHYLALLDGEPFGMIQTYLVSDYPDYAALIENDAAEAAYHVPGPLTQPGRCIRFEVVGLAIAAFEFR